MLANRLPKLILVHEFRCNFFVLVQTVYEEPLQSLAKHVAEIFHRIGEFRLAEVAVGYRVLLDRFEEQLVTRTEIPSESLIEDANQLGQFDLVSAVW